MDECEKNRNATARCRPEAEADNRGVGEDGYMMGTTGLPVGLHCKIVHIYLVSKQPFFNGKTAFCVSDDMVKFSKRLRPQVLIFTDLDGTLLDNQTYDFQPALPALKLIHSWKIPLILVSSKTRAEMELYMKSLALESPFIAENGGAIFFPVSFPLPKDYSYKKADDYNVVFIGRPLKELHEKIQKLKEQFLFKGFSEMPAREIADLTGLPLKQARLASEREFDEPIVLQNRLDNRGLFRKKACGLGLDCVYGGRFIHLFLGGDKGRAVEVVIRIYRQVKGPVFSIGLGDSPNDVSMLKVVDRAVLMQGRDHDYVKSLVHPELVRAEGCGPKAWNRVVLAILKDLHD